MKKQVSGTLRNGDLAEVMLFLKRDSNGRMIWAQRAVSDSARHLNRDYAGNETLPQIVETWLSCDWRRYEMVDFEATATPRGDE